MNKVIIISCIALSLSQSLFSQETKQVLFLGNSYTYVNDLPFLVASLADSLGDSLIYDSNTPGGYTFQGHSTNPTSLAKIAQQPWDFVVLQEQSQMPSFSPGQVATQVYPYADTLVRKIYENDSCSVPLFYMTWGRKNGDASNCATYPPVCTYAGMQARLRESYLQMSTMFATEVSPVGAAWKQVRDSFPLIELYNPDESHPSLEGSYLAACVFYASLFKKDPVGSGFTAGLSPQVALTLQQVASHTVLDSLSTWNMDTSAVVSGFSFSTTANQNEIQFTNSSQHSTRYFWDFGDGNFSNVTSPLHSFSGPGNYYITLIASRNFCLADTFVDTVMITITHAGMEDEELEYDVFPNPSSENWNLRMKNHKNSVTRISLMNAEGKEIFQRNSSAGFTILPGKELPAGIYFLRIEADLKSAGKILLKE